MFSKKKENSKEEQQPQPAEQPGTEKPAQDTAELQKQLEGLQKEKDDIFAKLQRVAADYDNYQKRSARQMADSITYEKDKTIKALLPVLDNFEYILANTSCGVNDEALLKGVKIIYEQLLGVLKGHGVEQIASAGENFDPSRHEAITQRTEMDKENGVVLDELQKGYMINGRVIRASRVVVNKIQAPQVEQQSEDPETKDTQ